MLYLVMHVKFPDRSHLTLICHIKFIGVSVKIIIAPHAKQETFASIKGSGAHGADSTGAMYRALGFSPGFAPDAGVSPYLKLLPMLMGIGSPGTIQEVMHFATDPFSAKLTIIFLLYISKEGRILSHSLFCKVTKQGLADSESMLAGLL